MRGRNLVLGGLVAAGVATASGGSYPAFGSETAPAASAVPRQARSAADDTASLSRLLNAVRGASPLFCEVVTRNVDGRWWSGSSNLIGFDSASAELLHWVRTEHRDPQFVPRLAVAMRDPDACVRRVAGSFLGHVEHPSAVTALVTALGDANAHTRAVAAIGLGIGEHEAALQPLILRLKDPAPEVRRSAAWALGAIENKAAMEALIELLGDGDARVRQAAAWAIGQVTS